MTLRERRAWIKFIAEAQKIPGLSEEEAALKADKLLEELVARCPEIRTAPRSPNRKPRWRKAAREAIAEERAKREAEAKDWAKERWETRTGVWGPYLAEAERGKELRDGELRKVEALRAEVERKAAEKFEFPWERERRERKPS